MINNAEVPHLRKYLATLGVSITLGSLGAGGFLLKSPGDLLVKQDDLRKLTPLAQDAIDHRQKIAYAIAHYGPYVLVFIAILGVALAAYGLVGWSRRQSVTDKIEDLEHEKIQVEIRQLTKEERAVNATQEAVEAQGGAGHETEEHQPQAKPRDRDAGLTSIKSRVLLSASLVEDKLTAGFPLHRVTSSVAIERGPLPPVEADAVLFSNRAGTPDYVLEMKYVTDRHNDPLKAIRSALHSVKTARGALITNKYATGKNGSCLGIVLIICESERVAEILKKNVSRRTVAEGIAAGRVQS